MAPDGETGPFAAEQADRLLRRLAYQAARTAKSPRAAEVHDFRVATRRFIQSLVSFDSCFPAKALKRIKRRLKKAMTLAGEVRDCDIALELLSKPRSAPAALISVFRRRRRELEKNLTSELRRWAQRRSYSRWKAELLSGGRGGINRDTIGVTASRTLQPMLRQFLGRGKRVFSSRAPAEKVHQLRVTAKKFRYTLEVFEPVYGAALRGWLERVKDLQDVLGAISDCETVRLMVKGEGGDATIEASLRRRVRRKFEEFRRLWAESFDEGSGRSEVLPIGLELARKPVAHSESRAPGALRQRAAHA